MTPALESDQIDSQQTGSTGCAQGSATIDLVVIGAHKNGDSSIEIRGYVEGSSSENAQIQAFVDGQPVPQDRLTISGRDWSLLADYIPFEPPTPLYGGVGLVVGNINIIILAHSLDQVAGKLITIPQRG